MSRLQIKGSRILNEMLTTDKRFILSIGGSRSSKTYSALQYLLIYCLKNQSKVVTIARKTFPSLRLGAMREFIEMLKDYDVYREEDHNKTNNFYTLNNNTIQFISIDQSIKLRGLKHDVLFVDEVNEISKEEADQLFMRTTEKIVMCENPSDALHWSLSYKSNPDCLYIHSTFRDNAFLPDTIKRQIESYKDTDEDMWSIYGLGLPAKNNELVYTQYDFWHSDDDLYEIDEEGKRHEKFEDVIIGCDWGYQHPSAIVKVWIDSNYKRLWVKEVIHESYLTTEDLIQKMKNSEIPEGIKLFGDSAEPKTIESVRRAGFDILPAMKEVREGIDCVKSYKLFVHSSSIKILEELRRYKWKVKNEMRTDEPVKLFDDALCALRYAIYTWTYKTQRANSYDFDIEFLDL
jgi:phage terminase large subunit